MEIIKEKLAFEGPPEPYKGYTMRATYLSEPKGDALIELLKDGAVVKKFLYAAYKIWNLAAHFEEIVDSELAGNADGYEAAGWTGFGGMVSPRPLEA